MKNPVVFASLGPGDPELVTLKSLKYLKEADCIYFPATSATGGEIVSRARNILEALGIKGDALHPFRLPMSKKREEAQKIYNEIALECIRLYNEGKKVAITAEGDAGFYSSGQYIYAKLTENGVPVQQLPGVPAFIASAAFAGLHVVKQEEPLLVLPGIVGAAELEQALQEGKTVVIMKLSQCETAVKACMHPDSAYQWHYFENVGLDTAFYSSNIPVIRAKKFPYFSLMIVKPSNAIP